MKQPAGGKVVHKQVEAALSRLGLGELCASTDALIHFLERVESAGLNLVSASDRHRLIERHLIPSLEALSWIPDQGRLLDVGSGGGFPAIPIAWARPELEVVLVESNQRKAAFLKRVSRETRLNRVRVIAERVEELDLNEQGSFDLISARSVTNIKEIIIWTQKLRKPDGQWLLWKGQNWREEWNDLSSLATTQVKLKEELPLSDGGTLLVVNGSPE